MDGHAGEEIDKFPGSRRQGCLAGADTGEYEPVPLVQIHVQYDGQKLFTPFRGKFFNISKVNRIAVVI